MGHWYTTTGEPSHTVLKADGSGHRDTTLRDARKLNLLPSVTGILNVWSNPGLDNWIQRNLLELAWANPPFASEEPNAYIGRIQGLAKVKQDRILNFGTAVHDGIEASLRYALARHWNCLVDSFEDNGDTYDLTEFVNPVVELFQTNGWEWQELESVVVGQGYAGTADCIFKGKDEYGIIDYKTCKDATAPESKLVKDSHPVQIAMYIQAECGGIDDKACGYNIYISREKNVGAVKVVRYDAERLRKELIKGQRAVAEWQSRNNYTPKQ